MQPVHSCYIIITGPLEACWHAVKVKVGLLCKQWQHSHKGEWKAILKRWELVWSVVQIKFHDKTSVKELSYSCSQSCHGLCLLLNLMTAHVTDAWRYMPVAFEAKAYLAQSDHKVYHPVHTFALHNFLCATKLRGDGRGAWQLGFLFTWAFTCLLQRREHDVQLQKHTCRINMSLPAFLCAILCSGFSSEENLLSLTVTSY